MAQVDTIIRVVCDCIPCDIIVIARIIEDYAILAVVFDSVSCDSIVAGRIFKEYTINVV